MGVIFPYLQKFILSHEPQQDKEEKGINEGCESSSPDSFDLGHRDTMAWLGVSWEIPGLVSHELPLFSVHPPHLSSE
jgi:hypothetical protein